jgi:hypothetical protein
MDPLEQIHSEGEMLRQVTSRPQKRLVVIGLWMIYGPTVLASVAMLFYFTLRLFTDRKLTPDFRTIFGFLGIFAICGGLSVILGRILFRVTRNYLQHLD